MTETQYLVAASVGMGLEESAVLFGVSKDAVKFGRRRACRLLAAKNTTHAVAEALRHGIIT